MEKIVNFDFDGTLFDSSKAYAKAIKKVTDIEIPPSNDPIKVLEQISKNIFKDENIDFSNIISSDDAAKEIAKKVLKEITTNFNFKPFLEFTKIPIYLKKIDELIVKEYTKYIKPEKGVENVLKELHNEKNTINIVSNNYLTKKIIDHIDWEGKEYISKILTPPRIKNKPSPDWFYHTQNQNPKDHFIIGDLPYDIIAGINAGLDYKQTIGYTGLTNDGKLKMFDDKIPVFNKLKDVKEYILEKNSSIS